MSVAGFVTRRALGSYAEVLNRLDAALAVRELMLVARIDHAAAAAQVGLSMSPLLVFVFGNPRAGTMLMNAQPTLGIDLPLKLVVWQDDSGVAVGYNDPVWLVERHGGDVGVPLVQTMRELLAELAQEAVA